MRKSILLSALLLFIISCTQAPQHAPQDIEEKVPVITETTMQLDDQIPIDPNITTGKLDNGITYYIRVNPKPENRAELRLAVNAGSVLEDNDQRGLAHFCEHMAFNGTKHFKKHELTDYLESIGMRFGPELNAYTGMDETVYMLQVPTENDSILETGFQILEDWAHNLSFEDDEIEKERGVIREEWRLGRGADGRIRDKQFPILLHDSQYAVRMPIGQIEIVDTCHYEILKRFYRDWYRPELQAVIAVGDFDKNKIEGLIKRYFSRIEKTEQGRERPLYPVPDHDETLFAVATDPEATRTVVSIYHKHDVKDFKTVNDFRKKMAEELYNSMFNQRLEELTKKPEPPIIYGYSAKGRFIRSREFYVLGAMVREGGIEKGLETLLTEAARVKEYGFTESELERSKKNTLRFIEKLYKERDKSKSAQYAAEYIRNFMIDEAIPGIEYEYKLYSNYLPGIELKEINQLADEWITEKNRVVMVSAPDKEDSPVPTEDDLFAVFDRIESKEITAYVDEVSSAPLIDKEPQAGKIISETKIDEIDITELELSNGIKVILKSTEFKNDEILLSAVSPGGNSLVENSSYIPALTSSVLMKEGGLGNFNKIELDKKLAGKVVRVNPMIRELTENITASTSPDDIETMFQLIHLFFTSPRKDSAAFLAYKTRMNAMLENKSADPGSAFRDTVRVTLAQHHFRARPWTTDLLDELNLEESFSIYKERFADASDFTFFIVGNFSLTSIKPLLEKYLASLPVLNRNEKWRDVEINPPKGVIEKTVKKGIEPKSYVSLAFTGPFEFNRYTRRDIRSMVDILRIMLREQIREEEGGTYGVRINASPAEYPTEEYKLFIEFGCDPERVDELIDMVMEQISLLKTEGPTDEKMTKIKEAYHRKREINLKENKFWLNTLQYYYFHNENPIYVLRMDELMDNLTNTEIQKAAQNYLNTDNFVKVVLLPEK